MTTNVTASSIKRLYNVDFLRLLSVVLIVYHHFISESYVQGAATPMLTWMKTNSRSIVFLEMQVYKLMRFRPTSCFAFHHIPFGGKARFKFLS